MQNRGLGNRWRTRRADRLPETGSSSEATWLATRRARTAAYFGSNCAPLGTCGALNNAPMMRCSISQTLEGLRCAAAEWVVSECRVLSRCSGGVRAHQRRTISSTVASHPWRIAYCNCSRPIWWSGWHALVACKCACISFFTQLMRVAIGEAGRDATCSTYRIHHSAILATNVMRAT